MSGSVNKLEVDLIESALALGTGTCEKLVERLYACNLNVLAHILTLRVDQA